MIRESSALDRSFAPGLGAPSEAREALEVLKSSLGVELLDRCQLVVTELVTNSIRHAGLELRQRVNLQVFVLERLLRIEVADDGQGFSLPVRKPAPGQSTGGWGLWLVDGLADRWGVEFRNGTMVWSEFDRNHH